MTDNLTSPAPEADEDEAKIWQDMEDADAALASAKADEDPVAAESSTPDQDEADPTDAPEDGKGQPKSGADEAKAEDDGTKGDDPWKDAPEHLKAMFEEERQARLATEAKLRDAKGREAATQRKLQQMLSTTSNRDEPPARGNAPSSPSKDRAEPSRSDAGGASKAETDTLSQIADDYPDLAPMVAEIAALRESAQRDAKIRELQIEVASAQQMDVLLTHHPDRYDVIKGNKELWAQWVEDQPKRVRDIVAENAENLVDGEAIAGVISAFKAHVHGRAEPASESQGGSQSPPNSLAAKRKAQLAGADAPARQTTRKPVTEGIPAEGDPEEIWNAFEEQERRQKQGRR